MPDADNPMRFMKMALEMARQSAGRGEVPVGAVIEREGELLAAAGNERELRDRKSTRLNSSHIPLSRMPFSA